MKSPSTEKKWQPETVKHLISLYELQPLLYNVNSPAYHNKSSRNVANETIANELYLRTKIKFTTDEVIKKLNGLRTQFLNVERTRKKGVPSGAPGSPSTFKPSWWLYESLQFLLPFVKKDRGDTNLVLNRSFEGAQMERTHSNEIDLPDNVSASEPDEQIYQRLTVSPDASRESTPGPSFAPEQQNLASRPLKRKRSAKNKSTNEEILRDTLEKIANEKDDPIDLFTGWVGSELKVIKNSRILKTLKMKTVNLIDEAQNEDELL